MLVARVRAAVAPPRVTHLWVKAAAIFLGLRLVSWLLLAQAADQQVWFPAVTGPNEDDIDLALSWDAKWYERIATGGYPDELPVGADGRVQQNPWAFYPVFPYAVRAVSRVTTLDFATLAPLLALLAGVGAAVVMAQLLVETLPARTHGPALAAVAVWAAFPTSPVLQMAYSESFSMLLLVSFLLVLIRGHWWGAAGLALVLGLTRPIALPLSVLVVVAVWMRWRDHRVDPQQPIRSGERAAMLGTLAATGFSGVLWTTIAAVSTGRRDAYPATMTAWRGEASINVLQPWIQTIEWAFEFHQREFVLPALGIAIPTLLALVTLIPRVAPGIDLRLRVWSVAYSLYLLAVVDGGTSIFRYLVPLFPLAVVLVGAHRQRRGEWVSRWWRVRTTFWVVAGIVGQVGWIWWLVLFTPPSDYPP